MSTIPSAIESSMNRPDLVAVAVQSIHTMADGARADFDPLYAPNATDRENQVQPPPSRIPGRRRLLLHRDVVRAAFADLHYDVHHAFGEGDLVVVNSTMNGHHVAPWTVYTADARVDSVFPPTGRPFAVTQSHWFRFSGGRIIEHWANRDDLGMARQLGWVPPSPAFLVKMAWAKRRAERA